MTRTLTLLGALVAATLLAYPSCGGKTVGDERGDGGAMDGASGSDGFAGDDGGVSYGGDPDGGCYGPGGDSGECSISMTGSYDSGEPFDAAGLLPPACEACLSQAGPGGCEPSWTSCLAERGCIDILSCLDGCVYEAMSKSGSCAGPCYASCAATCAQDMDATTGAENSFTLLTCAQMNCGSVCPPGSNMGADAMTR